MAGNVVLHTGSGTGHLSAYCVVIFFITNSAQIHAMSYASYLPANRAVLFANLGQALNNGEKFPDLFDSVADVSPGCYHSQLASLAVSIREQPDLPLLELMKRSPVFLPWELRYIQFGLATLKISEVFARLCDYYVLIGGVSRRLVFWISGVWVLLGLSLSCLLVSVVDMPEAETTVAVAFLAIISARLGWGLLPLLVRNWIEPNSGFWGIGAKIPILQSMVVTRSVYQYLLNLGLCIQGGLDLDRSLKVTAKSEPVAWLRQRYQGVAEDVAAGAQISEAFMMSGVLARTKILTADSQAKPAGAIWEPGITDIVRHSFSRQLNQVVRLLPFFTLVPLILVWLGILLMR